MTEAQLRAFVAVTDAGGFAEAARRLHMSQPGVSRAVRALETELGGDLLLRARGTATLTTLGERVLARSRVILAETEAIRHERDQNNGIASGHVRLGSMPSVSATILPPLLSRLHHRHPTLTIAVLDGHDDELVEWIRTGTVDLAVVAGHPDGLELHPLASDELLAVLPANHALASQATVHPRELAAEPFILTRAGCERLILASLAAHGVTPTISHEVTEATSVIAMVSERLGVSIMPRLVVPDPPHTIALRPLTPRAERRLSIAITPTHAPSPAACALLTQLDANNGNPMKSPLDV